MPGVSLLPGVLGNKSFSIVDFEHVVLLLDIFVLLFQCDLLLQRGLVQAKVRDCRRLARLVHLVHCFDEVVGCHHCAIGVHQSISLPLACGCGGRHESQLVLRARAELPATFATGGPPRSVDDDEAGPHSFAANWRSRRSAELNRGFLRLQVVLGHIDAALVRYGAFQPVPAGCGGLRDSFPHRPVLALTFIRHVCAHGVGLLDEVQ